MNRWELTDEVRNEYKPIVESFLKDVEDNNLDISNELLEKDFSDTKLNPYTLGKILEELGYECVNRDDNGWELDFWIDYHKDRCKNIQVSGTGITFELNLSECETNYREIEKEQEEKLKNLSEKIVHNVDSKFDELMKRFDEIMSDLQEKEL